MKVDLGEFNVDRIKVCGNRDFPSVACIELTGIPIKSIEHIYESTLFVPADKLINLAENILYKNCKLILEIEG